SDGDTEIPLGLTASLRCRIADGRRDEALALEPRQRRIHAPEKDLAAALLLNRARDRHTVGILADPDDSEQHHQLEIPQPFTTHLFNYTELIGTRQARDLTMFFTLTPECSPGKSGWPARSPSFPPPSRRPCSTRP